MRSCVVCYTEHEKIKLVCNHSFCYDCIKQWYLKNPSCPMCRSPLYFRGFYKIRNKWNQEQQEKQFNEIYEECVDDIMENSFLPLYDLESLERLYNRIKDDIETPEQLEWMLENYIDFFDEDCIIFDDIFSFVKNLFVSKHSYKTVYSGFPGPHLKWINFPEVPRRIHIS